MNNYIEIQELNRTQPYDFGIQQVRKNALGETYQMNGRWTDTTPVERPQARRFLFQDFETRQAMQDVYACWKTLASQSQNQPVEQEKIFARFVKARNTQEPLTLFIPWGVRPQGSIGKEYDALEKIQKVQNLLLQFSIPSCVFIMPADIYATEINGIFENKTQEYFQDIENLAKEKGMEVKAWSVIREENRKRYEKIASQLNEQTLSETIGKAGTLERIFSAAQRRSERSNTQKAAYDYLRERIIEAIIIEDMYEPVKLSLAPKNKDNTVDQKLPRLYLIPTDLQLPWLQQ